MKILLVFIAFITVSGTCHNTTGSNRSAGKQANSTCFKARLEIKGICMNYVIKILEGDTAALKLEREWKDETDGKVYTNVFALGNICSFPDMAEGTEFYFTLTNNADTQCNVCMAFRPVPSVKNNIIVSQTPCR
jgi:hypothetical protein